MHNEIEDSLACDTCHEVFFTKDEVRPYLAIISVPSNERNFWHFCDKLCLQEWVNKSLPIKN